MIQNGLDESVFLVVFDHQIQMLHQALELSIVNIYPIKKILSEFFNILFSELLGLRIRLAFGFLATIFENLCRVSYL